MPAEPSTVTDVDANPLWGGDWVAGPGAVAAGEHRGPPQPRLVRRGAHAGARGAAVLAGPDGEQPGPLLPPRAAGGALASARSEVGAFLGAAEGSLAFVHNATSGASTVLSAFPLAAGDAVLLTDHSYGAVRIAAHRFATDRGARSTPCTSRSTADDDEVLALVLGAVHDRTRLVVLDHVTSPTARRLPLVTLVPALQERGLAVLVDGAHAPGMLAVDLERLGADFFVGNLHKWCCAPRGTAVLHAAERWRPTLRPLVASWGEADGFPLAFDDTGTEDPTAWLSSNAPGNPRSSPQEATSGSSTWRQRWLACSTAAPRGAQHHLCRVPTQKSAPMPSTSTASIPAACEPSTITAIPRSCRAGTRSTRASVVRWAR